MLEIAILSIVLSREPIKCSRTDEEEKIVCFYESPIETEVMKATEFPYTTFTASTDQKTFPVNDFPSTESVAPLSVNDRFRQLAERWSKETENISSVNKMVSHPSYQAIIKLGWEVVPLLLNDLQENEGFWYPALNAITGIRPFDPSDAGNARRMTKAWLTWGHKKGLI
jgi:hypothetical protein